MDTSFPFFNFFLDMLSLIQLMINNKLLFVLLALLLVEHEHAMPAIQLAHCI
jgi:hypothetical protein